MSYVGQREGFTQNCIIRFFNDESGYRYLGLIPGMQYSEAFSVPSLNSSRIEQTVFPERDEQTTITISRYDMEEEIQSLRQRLNKTCQITQSMMQELLTGKTRLVKPEVTA